MEYYLTKHGIETFKKVIENISKFSTNAMPIKINLLGIGTLTFNNHSELYGFIYALRQILKANEGEKNDS